MDKILEYLKKAIRERADDEFNLAYIRDAPTYAFLQGALPKRVSFDAPAAPATVPEPKLIYNNSENRPYVIHVRAANVQQTSVILLLDRTAENCKPTTAQIALEGVTPLLRNRRLRMNLEVGSQATQVLADPEQLERLVLGHQGAPRRHGGAGNAIKNDKREPFRFSVGQCLGRQGATKAAFQRQPVTGSAVLQDHMFQRASACGENLGKGGTGDQDQRRARHEHGTRASCLPASGPEHTRRGAPQPCRNGIACAVRR